MVGPAQIKFYIPDECRTFTIFPLLPAEIREAVWEAYLSTPGIHFLKLQTNQEDWSWTERQTVHATATAVPEEIEEREKIRNLVKEDKQPRERHPTCLIPVGPSPKADVSHYKALRRQLATLSRTCVESRNVVKRLCNRPGTLKLGDGKLISLGQSSDLIYLDYFPPSLYQGNGNLETAPDCPDLKRVRRVAVRFSHTWRPTRKPCLCSLCKKDKSPSHNGVYPSHLYQLLARHFPNLEEFFFIDYFSVYRNKDQLDDEATPFPDPSMHTQRFQAGNRTYHEVNEEDWIMNKDVFLITTWLHQNFLRYAMHSPLCQHKYPEKVRFSVLACQWNISPAIQKEGAEIRSDVRKRAATFLRGGPTRRLYPRSGRHRLLFNDFQADSQWLPMSGQEVDDIRHRNFIFPSMSTPVSEAELSQRQVTATAA